MKVRNQKWNTKKYSSVFFCFFFYKSIKILSLTEFKYKYFQYYGVYFNSWCFRDIKKYNSVNNYPLVDRFVDKTFTF